MSSDKESLLDHKPNNALSHPDPPQIVPKIGSFSIEESDCIIPIQTTEPERSLCDRVKGILLCLFSKLFFILCITSIKYCYLNYEDINGYDYILFRGTISTLTAAAEARVSGINIFKIQKEIRFGVFLRFIAGGIGMPCFFIALKYLPTSQCHITLNIYPLLNAILAYFLLKEILRIRDIFCLIGAFVGAFVINSTQSDVEGAGEEEDRYTLGIVLILVALCFRSTGIVAMKLITKHANSVYSPFYYAIGMLINGLVLLVFFREQLHFESYTLTIVFLLTFSSLMDYTSQSIMSYASKFEKATILAPMSYVSTCLILLNDLIIFHYEFRPMYFVGFAIIFICVLIPIIFKLYL